MKVRLSVIVGAATVDKLMMGTLCVITTFLFVYSADLRLAIAATASAFAVRILRRTFSPPLKLTFTLLQIFASTES